MPILVIAVIFFALFLAMGVLATVAVLSETRGMPGSVLQFKRVRNSPRRALFRLPPSRRPRRTCSSASLMVPFSSMS